MYDINVGGPEPVHPKLDGEAKSGWSELYELLQASVTSNRVSRYITAIVTTALYTVRAVILQKYSRSFWLLIGRPNKNKSLNM